MTIVKNIKTAAAFVAVLWLVHIINIILFYGTGFDLRNAGLKPHRIEWLWGIIWAPFLHANFYHLFANSSALLVLFSVALSFSRKLAFVAVFITWIMGGGLVWFFGRTGTTHIGASGIIFGLIGFLVFIGIFRREWKALAVSIIIFFFYGGAVSSLLVHVPGVSWSGHFFGFLSGVTAAWLTREKKRG